MRWYSPMEAGRQGHRCRAPYGPSYRTRSNNKIWPEIFLSFNASNPYACAQDHDAIRSQGRQSTGKGCMGLQMAGRGERGHALEFSRAEQSQSTHEQGDRGGQHSNKDHRR